MNKASGGYRILAKLFQILEDDAVKVPHSIYQQIWKTQQWPQDWKRSVFIPIPKKGNAKESSNYRTIALISHASKVIIKIFQTRLQQYVNRGIPNIQAGFRKGRRIRDQLSNIHWIIEKKEKSRETSTSASLNTLKLLTVWIKTNGGKKEMRISDLLTCLLRNLYAGQEITKLHMEQWSGSKLGKEYITLLIWLNAYWT